MQNMHGIIFAYQKNAALKELSEPRATSSIPFLSRYRLIDFSLSSMINAGVNHVGVILQDRYQSLLDHLGSGKDWDLSRRSGGLKLLPPFSADAETGYKGDLDALRSVYSYLVRIKEDYVVLADGDLVANLPLSDLYSAHCTSGKDLSVFTREGEILPVYLISTKLLLEITGSPEYQALMHWRDVLADSRFQIGHLPFTGYTADLCSIEGYYRSSMALLAPALQRELFVRPIRTKERSDVSTYYGPAAHSKNCMVADGCYIEGSIENCILFRGVRVGRGAKLKNCILMQDTVIGEMAKISHLIADKNVGIAPRSEITGHSLYPLTVGKNSRIGF